jgi:hypothetical protein
MIIEERYWRSVDTDRLPSEYDIYEFGVGCPYTDTSSTKRILNFCKHSSIKFSTYRGFDSFTGLPELTQKDDVELCNSMGWHEGKFSAIDFYSPDSDGLHPQIPRESFPVIDDVRRIVEHTTQEFAKLIQPGQKISITPGFFNDTLPELDVSGFKPALIAHIDCDLYSSAYTVLEFLFKNNLIVDQTFILFDDWHCTGDHTGEKLAFKEITEQYDLFEYVTDGYDNIVNNYPVSSSQGFKCTTPGSLPSKYLENVTFDYQKYNENNI